MPPKYFQIYLDRLRGSVSTIDIVQFSNFFPVVVSMGELQKVSKLVLGTYPVLILLRFCDKGTIHDISVIQRTGKFLAVSGDVFQRSEHIQNWRRINSTSSSSAICNISSLV